MVDTAPTRPATAPNYGGFIDEDWERLTFRVHRSALRDEDVFERERGRIFDRSWLYVGHESEIAKSGDWKVRRVGGRNLIFCRDLDGEVQLYFNTCPHRGTTICRAEDEGNARFFQCFYHAWTFNLKGELTGIPDPSAYPEADFRERYTLRRPAHHAELRGFHFVAYDPDAGSLADHLGAAADYILMMTEHSEKGIKMIPGTQEYSVRANWKMAVENALDGYHFSPTHATYVDWLHDTGFKVHNEGGRVESLGNGHAVLIQSGHGGRVGLKWEPRFGEAQREQSEASRARLVERLGEERGGLIAGTSRILFVFPNLLLFDIISLAVRQLEPLAAGLTEVNAWEMAPIGEPPETTQLRIRMLGAFIGPGGLATPDDIEAYEAVQRGLQNTAGDPRPGVDWNDISRGMAREKAGEYGRSVDESGIRSFWRHWAGTMAGSVS